MHGWTQWLTGRQLALLALAALAAANSGCLAVAAGAAVGAGAAGYAYAKGRVNYTFNTSLDDSWAAAHKALTELNLPILGEERETNRSGTIRSELSDGTPVRVFVEVADGDGTPGSQGTEVSVRVGAFGDYAQSDRILRQISMHLAPAGGGYTGAATPATTSSGSWTAVHPVPVAPPPVQPQPMQGQTIAPQPVPPPPLGGPAPTAPPPLLPPEPMTKQ